MSPAARHHGLEARALAEVAARPKSEATDSWISESPFAVQAKLAALHGNPRRAATVLRGALEHGVGPDYYWYSERAAFDRIRVESAVRELVHNPALDHRPP